MVRIAEFVGFSGVLGGSRGSQDPTDSTNPTDSLAPARFTSGFPRPARHFGEPSNASRSRDITAYRVLAYRVLVYWRIARRSAPPNASHAATARIGLLARACAPPAGEAGGALRPCRRAPPPSSPAHCTDASSITSPGARAGIVCAASRRAAAFAAQGRAT
nr:hypothetical protein DO63_5013 [Burkholderia pseudomallei]